MNTIILDIIIACVLVLAGAGVVYHHEHGLVTAANVRADAAEKATAALVAQRAVDDATTALVAAKKAKIAASGASAAVAMQAAQAAHHDWASGLVPADVQAALK